jgi:large subunit ribosomal protein L17
MHRHGYSGRKFGRERDQREALIKGLAESLIIHESITTTLPKAKEVVPYVEKLITKAKKNTLHARRQVISSLNTLGAAHKLVDEVVPMLASRNSGYFRIAKTVSRRGDNAQMATISFVDSLKKTEAPASKRAEATAKTETVAKETKKPAANKAAPAKKAPTKKKETK